MNFNSKTDLMTNLKSRSGILYHTDE